MSRDISTRIATSLERRFFSLGRFLALRRANVGPFLIVCYGIACLLLAGNP
jgi:hypothetical protein